MGALAGKEDLGGPLRPPKYPSPGRLENRLGLPFWHCYFLSVKDFPSVSSRAYREYPGLRTKGGDQKLSRALQGLAATEPVEPWTQVLTSWMMGSVYTGSADP